VNFVPNHSSDKRIWFEKSVNNEINYIDYFTLEDKEKPRKSVKIQQNNISIVCPKHARKMV